MSFHRPHSDVSRLNAGALERAVTVDPDTFTVLRHALDMSRASDGAFDITVGGALVALRRLPQPPSRHLPDPAATWREIELIGPDSVRFHRPLWVDLGGIAKGYAVDCGIRRVATEEAIGWCVNAGGDLRVSGPASRQVVLDNQLGDASLLAVVELRDASLASSGGLRSAPPQAAAGPPIHGVTRASLDGNTFVSVVAAEAVIADALTKVVFAQPDRAAAALREFGATAYFHHPSTGWIEMGTTGARGGRGITTT